MKKIGNISKKNQVSIYTVHESEENIYMAISIWGKNKVAECMYIYILLQNQKSKVRSKKGRVLCWESNQNNDRVYFSKKKTMIECN